MQGDKHCIDIAMFLKHGYFPKQIGDRRYKVL